MAPRAGLRLAAALVGLLLAGCAATGDFGRRQPSVVTDMLMPQAGAEAARERHEPVSPYPLTDDERELRDRAWTFLIPARPRGDLDVLLVELHASRVTPRLPQEDPAAYLEALRIGERRSSVSAYRQLGSDVVADEALLPPLCDAIARVAAADRLRTRGLGLLADLSPAERADALARVAENGSLVAWIDTALGRRLGAYHYALERLFVATPEREGVGTERALDDLDAQAGTRAGPADGFVARCVGGPLPWSRTARLDAQAGRWAHEGAPPGTPSVSKP